MRVTITGARGAIGRSLITQLVLDSSLEISALARAIPPGLETSKDKVRGKVHWMQGDLTSYEDCCLLVRDQQVIVHLAHTNVPLSSDRDLPSDALLNLVPTLNLLKAIREQGKCPHLVYASSGGAVYGRSLDRVPFKEDHLCQPVSSYGIQKLAAEHYIRLCAERGYLTATILRISNVYGWLLSPERNQGFIGIALAQALERSPIRIWGDPNNVRDYIHIEDVIAAFQSCLRPLKPFDIFNIGTGVGFAIFEIVALMEELLGHRLKQIHQDHPAAEFLPDWCVLDISKATKQLGWKPRITLQQGLSRMLKQHAKHRRGKNPSVNLPARKIQKTS